MIEDLIEEQIKLLKPALKSRFIYRILDKESDKYAETNRSFIPPLITFYSKNVEKMIDKPIKQSIRELISHELLHVLQYPHSAYDIEKECREKFMRMNFFIE